MDMSKFNQGDIFHLMVEDADCYGCGIGHNKAKFRFCLGEMDYLINEQLRCLFTEQKNCVVVDLYLYGIKNLKMKFISTVQMRYAHVVDFNEVNGDLLIRLNDEGVGIIEYQMGYDSYKWEFVKEYSPDELTIEEEDRLAEDTISEDEYSDIVWND